MFEIIPCVDIQNGRAVRLFEGDPKGETVYFESSLEVAQRATFVKACRQTPIAFGKRAHKS